MPSHSYRAEIRNGSQQWRLVRRVGGSDKALAFGPPSLAAAILPGVAYEPRLTIVGGLTGTPPSISLEFRRASDGLYLSPTGTWQAGPIACLAAVDEAPGAILSGGGSATRTIGAAGTRVEAPPPAVEATDPPQPPAEATRGYRGIFRNGSEPWRIVRQADAIDTVLATSSPRLAAAIRPGLAYRPGLAVRGGDGDEPVSIALEFQRLVDGLYLDPDANWRASKVACLTATDDSPDAIREAGYSGYLRVVADGSSGLFEGFAWARSFLVTPETDYAAYSEILARLRATGAYVLVEVSTNVRAIHAPSEGQPYVALVPDRAINRDLYDEGVQLRTVHYLLYLASLEPDFESRDAQLVAMEASARKALSGISFGAFCLPALSRIDSVIYPLDKEKSLTAQAILHGSFAYLIEGYQAVETADLYLR